MRILDQGLIFDARSKPASERVCCFTGLRRLSSGVVAATFQVGPSKHAPKSSLRICLSTDDGRSWRELPARFETRFLGVPGSLAAGELIDLPGGKWLLFATWFDRSDPARPLFDPLSEGILHSRQLVAVSRDSGATWSTWQELELKDLTGCALTGPPLVWPDGTVAFAFESFKEFDDPSPARHAAWLALSTDGGKCFDRLHLVARHPRSEIFYWDQRLTTAGSDGQYAALFWTHDRAHRQDLNVHLLYGSIHEPNDALPVETPLRGQIAAPRLLPDGRLLAFVVDRSKPATMTLWQSLDRGQTWPIVERLTVYSHDERARLSQQAKDIDFAQYWEDMGKWTFGHPAVVLLADQTLLLAWYAGDPGCLSLHWARVAV